MVNHTCFRFLRAFRSTCAPFTAIVGFSCLLTFIFILYQPSAGPGLSQRLGWQSWDTITPPNGMKSSSTVSNPSTEESSSNVPEGTDWWDVATENEKVDFASLPLDQWTPLLPHDTGFSEIAVVHCWFDPRGVPAGLCEPPSTTQLDAIHGKWVRVQRDLSLEAGITAGYLSLFYRRTRRQDVNLITNITLLPDNTEPWPIEGWQKADTSVRKGWGTPLYLWYHATKTAAQMTTEERQKDLITELDVLYGDDVPWYGFERVHPAILDKEGSKIVNTWITIRRGVKTPPRAPPLHFSREGNFRILQVADLHFSIADGECRDTRTPCSGSDNLTSTLLGKVLDIEQPNLVVFTGDQLNGQRSSWDPKSILAKLTKPVADRKIPWAAVFGNHDGEDGATKEEQMRLMQALPYSLVEPGPKDIHGVGNYVLKVKSADPSKTHILTLYFLDSGDYSKGVFDWFGLFTGTDYDWIHQDQIDWFLLESSKIDPIERPFHPDGGKDLGNVWRRKRQEQITPQTRRLAKPNALMFFHIPLPEAYSPADVDPRTRYPLDVGIKGNEPAGNAKKSDKFFEKGLLKAMETEHISDSVLEVKAVANGHCHITENCRRVKGVWMCFGGGGSYSGYGKVGFDRRFRVYDVSDFGETIETYKRTESDAVINKQVLAGKGAVPLSR